MTRRSLVIALAKVLIVFTLANERNLYQKINMHNECVDFSEAEGDDVSIFGKIFGSFRHLKNSFIKGSFFIIRDDYMYSFLFPTLIPHIKEMIRQGLKVWLYKVS